jgi:hypothetical protein
MSRKTIPGVVLYDVLANLNRPKCPHCLRREALELAGRGLSARDVADAMRVDLATAMEWLAGAA